MREEVLDWVAAACLTILVVVLAGTVAACLSGCRTVDAIVEAPGDYWWTTFEIAQAIFEDILSIIRLFLPI